MSTLDTHQVVEDMIASGVEKRQAEIITKAIRQSENNLVTKSDLELSLSDLRSDMKWIKGLMFLVIGLITGLWFK
jgi:hypothetical protein